MANEYKFTKVVQNFNKNDIYLTSELAKFNQKYMLNLKRYSLSVYDLNKNKCLDDIKLQDIYHFDFHSNYENIFFVCAGKDVIIYKIDNFEIVILSTIKGHYINVDYGAFNPFKPYIFLTASNDGFIKIYDLNISSAISLINLEESFEDNYEVKWGNKDIGLKKNDIIIYFEYNNFKKESIKKYCSERVSDFYFLNDNDDSLIIIKPESIEIVKNNKQLYEYKECIQSSFYFQKDKILLIINSQSIQLLKINDNNQINNLFCFNQEKKNAFFRPLFINENFLYSNEIFKFYDPKIIGKELTSYIITCNNKNVQNNIKNETNKIKVQNVKNIIYDIPILLSKNNNDLKTEDPCFNVRNKKYYEIEDIKNELIKVKKRSFITRKSLVKKYVEEQKDKNNSNEKNHEKYDNIGKKYIQLLTLLINDDTNKDLLKEYLNFLKENDAKLISLYNDCYEEFQDELNYYYIFFDTQELKSDFNLVKKSQKEEFIENLLSISKLNKDNKDDVAKFEIILKQKECYFENIPFFNLPIDISNEQLFYYRNINLFNFYLRDVLYEFIKRIENKKTEIEKNQLSDTEKKKEIEKFKNKELINELDIISSNINACIDKFNDSNNFAKKNELIITLVAVSDKNLFNFCYKYLYSDKNKIKINELIQNSSAKEEIDCDIHEKVDIELDLIKQFYKNILPLECFRSVYYALYGEDSYYPFDDEEFTEKFVDDNLKILDSPALDFCGLTDKLTMNTYFIPFLPEIVGKKVPLHKNQEKIMQNGYLIRTGNHEIGHNFTNLKFYNENCKISIRSPRKKTLDFIEGGYYLDIALFGKILKTMNFAQALYVLNEENYKKTYLDFQFGFNNINNKDLEVTGAFAKECEDITNILTNKFPNKANLVFINFNPYISNDTIINCAIKNDLLFGVKISDEEYKKIIKTYG